MRIFKEIVLFTALCGVTTLFSAELRSLEEIKRGDNQFPLKITPTLKQLTELHILITMLENLQKKETLKIPANLKNNIITIYDLLSCIQQLSKIPQFDPALNPLEESFNPDTIKKLKEEFGQSTDIMQSENIKSAITLLHCIHDTTMEIIDSPELTELTFLALNDVKIDRLLNQYQHSEYSFKFLWYLLALHNKWHIIESVFNTLPDLKSYGLTTLTQLLVNTDEQQYLVSKVYGHEEHEALHKTLFQVLQQWYELLTKEELTACDNKLVNQLFEYFINDFKLSDKDIQTLATILLDKGISLNALFISTKLFKKSEPLAIRVFYLLEEFSDKEKAQLRYLAQQGLDISILETLSETEPNSTKRLAYKHYKELQRQDPNFIKELKRLAEHYHYEQEQKIKKDKTD